MNILFLDTAKFSADSRAGLHKWPTTVDETQGYVTQAPGGDYHLLPVETVSLDEIPAKLARRHNVIGTFHSHPFGCHSSRCYHQPPSLKDLESFRRLSLGPVGLPVHLIVTKGGIVFVKTHRSSKKRWNEMMKKLGALQQKKNMPREQEPLWYNLAAEFPDVMTVTRLKH